MRPVPRTILLALAAAGLAALAYEAGCRRERARMGRYLVERDRLIGITPAAMRTALEPGADVLVRREAEAVPEPVADVFVRSDALRRNVSAMLRRGIETTARAAVACDAVRAARHDAGQELP